ncbi:DUF1707 domain-containing protein [Rhodococcus rhodnii]|nr:DUF1707 domain-containing protein [Rhodococcus rhodnii]TXG92497.1 DUF1707 domain-containing protein [Rhodococcus rhodnii]
MSDDDLRLGDDERLHALNVLGNHYAAGRLDMTEFDERSKAVAAARTVSAVRPAFGDLPGGVPLVVEHGSIRKLDVDDTDSAPAVVSGTSAVREGELELQKLLVRGRRVEVMDGIIVGATLVVFLVLQFVVGWGFAWIVWPSLALTLGIPRALAGFSDDDEELYDELKEAAGEERKARLREASKRIAELGDGRENRS